VETEAQPQETELDVEQQFLQRAQQILESQGVEEPEEVEEEPEVEEPEEQPEDPEQEEEPAEEDEEEEEDEDLPKISIRVDGKKADPETLLQHMTFTPKVDGEEIEVDYQELINGYQRGTDYAKKTTEVKRLKEELQPYQQMVSFAKNDPQFVQYVQSYFQNGPDAEVAKNPDLKVSDSELAGMMDRNSDSYDPDRAATVMKARGEWQKHAAERREVMEKAQRDMMASYSEWAADQITKAREAIDAIGEPADKDGKGEYERKSPQVLETLKSMGFNDDEISGRSLLSATDARAAVLAYKASEYDRMMREAEAPKARLGKKRKRYTPPRTQQPGTGTRQQPARRQQRDNYRKAVKSQNDDAWVNVIAGRLK
jgi:hypothetical protein